MVRDGSTPRDFRRDEQFDSDITDGRHPRAALGVAGGIALSLTCDGRGAADAGLSLGELAELMAALGAQRGDQPRRRRVHHPGVRGPDGQRPRELDGNDIPGGRPIYTALTFTPARRRADGGRSDSLALA